MYFPKIKDLKGETFLHLYFRWLSLFVVVNFLSKTKITPNQITIFRNIFFIVGIIIFIFTNSFKVYFILLFFFLFLEWLDSVDGDLARYTNKKSKLGVYLELVFDYMFWFLFGLFGLALVYKIYYITNDYKILLFYFMYIYTSMFKFLFYIKFNKNSWGLFNNNHLEKYPIFKNVGFFERIKNIFIFLKIWENYVAYILFLIFFNETKTLNIVTYIFFGILILINCIIIIKYIYKGYLEVNQ